MKYICNACKKHFSAATKTAGHCIYCGSDMLEPASRSVAMKKVQEYKAIEAKMKRIMDEEYIPLYLEAETIRAHLRTYKSRGIITQNDLPDIQKPNLMKMLSAYRAERRAKKEGNI